MFTPFTRLQRFRKDTDGYITLEILIVLPVLLWIFAAAWIYFDVFQQYSAHQKANYAIGDMLSRETQPITDDYLDNSHSLLELLNNADETALRVTVVSYDSDAGWELEWSEARGAASQMAQGDMSDYRSRLPAGLPGDQLILVETWDSYAPIFEVGLSEFDIHTYSFTRPRFAPQLVLG